MLDEADRMLDMGFIGPVKAICGRHRPAPQDRAVFGHLAPEVAELAKGLLNAPVRVEASPRRRPSPPSTSG